MWWWVGGAYAAGVPTGVVLNVLMLLGSGGFVTRPWAIVRNGLLWPVMLPLVVGMYLGSRGR